MTQSILPLQLKALSVRKRGKAILNKITTTIEPTGFTIVMGPNGAGKTTLLRAIHGLERVKPDALIWNADEATVRNGQTFIFQTPIMMRRSVLQNIAYPLILRGMDRKTAEGKAYLWAEKVGITRHLDTEAPYLSGGERQKLAIARALVVEPELLFLDEPTTNLDGSSTREIESILQLAHETGTRIMMTTHDLGQAKRLATEILFLHNGVLVDVASADMFFTAPQSAAAKAYLAGEIVE